MTDQDLQVEAPEPEDEPSEPTAAQLPHAVPDEPPPFPGQGPEPIFDERQDGYTGVVPYRNKPALIAYYCAVFALIPLFPIGLTALFLGLRGLKNVRRDPAVRGTAHAWIGILVGGGFGVLWLVLSLGIAAKIVAS